MILSEPYAALNAAATDASAAIARFIEALNRYGAPTPGRRRHVATGQKSPGRTPRDYSIVDADVLAAVHAGARHGRAIASSSKVNIQAVRRSIARLMAAGVVEQHGRWSYTQFVPVGVAPEPRKSRAPRVAARRDAEAVATLESLPRPTTSRLLAKALGISHVQMRRCVARLLAAGVVVAHGTTTDRKIGLPRVMQASYGSLPPAATPPVRPPVVVKAPAAAPKVETKPKKAHAPKGNTIEVELRRVLRSGASYDTKELRRNILGAFPAITLDEIDAACFDLVASGALERIRISERITRYRLFHKSKGDE